MIKVNVTDKSFSTAYWNARRALPVEDYESPRQYGIRWRETHHCRIESSVSGFPWFSRKPPNYIFDNDQDYTWFMLRWA